MSAVLGLQVVPLVVIGVHGTVRWLRNTDAGARRFLVKNAALALTAYGVVFLGVLGLLQVR